MNQKSQQLLYNLQILNNVTIAFLVNDLFYTHNINLNEYRPTCGDTLHMTKITFSLDPGTQHQHEVDSFYHRYYEDFDGDDFIKEMNSLGIEKFFEKYFKSHVVDMSSYFSKRINKNPYCDLVFNNMPDFQPFPCSLDRDPETGVACRTAAGSSFGTNNLTVITDIHCLIVDRFREMGENRIGIVANMNDEEKKLYNVQPKNGEEDVY